MTLPRSALRWYSFFPLHDASFLASVTAASDCRTITGAAGVASEPPGDCPRRRSRVKDPLLRHLRFYDGWQKRRFRVGMARGNASSQSDSLLHINLGSKSIQLMDRGQNMRYTRRTPPGPACIGLKLVTGMQCKKGAPASWASWLAHTPRRRLRRTSDGARWRSCPPLAMWAGSATHLSKGRYQNSIVGANIDNHNV